MRNQFIFIVLVLNLLLSVPAVKAQRINVTESPYGAIPDDGGDDTGAINAAVANGTDIYFPPGRYNFNGTIDLRPTLSYRLSGDGPGVSTIAFTVGASGRAGIVGANIGNHTLTVDGLTLLADSYNAGTAIYATFDAPVWNPTARIHNVQIVGSTVTGATGGYWDGGIHLNKAQNAVIDKVEINGNNRDEDSGGGRWPTEFGIVWESPHEYQTIGLQMSNLEIHYCNTALRTNGWVQDLFLTNFEFVLSGQHDRPLMDLRTSDVAKRANFQVVSGHLNALQHGIRLTNLREVTISKVFFIKYSDPQYTWSGDHLAVDNCSYVVLSHNSFDGPQAYVDDANGIHLYNSTYWVHIEGNYFHHLLPRRHVHDPNNYNPNSGNCFLIRSNVSTVGIINNLFETVDTLHGVRNRIRDESGQAYYDGSNN